MRDLITKIELAMFESALNPTDPADDYAAKKKALYDLETNPNVMQEPELMKAVAQRKADLEREAHKHGVKEDGGFGKPERDWDEGDTEPPNNFAIYINGKKWKVLPGRGTYADDYREKQQYRQLQDMCAKKSAATGKKWQVSPTGEAPT
jgi:hypothetical protein